MADYRISRKAAEDLNRIWIYTYENWSIEQANRFYDQLAAQLNHYVLKVHRF
ncbi:MAG: type II toxin-antitoxin system RelE/ParE family toxin [Bacteroidetes bacterium]|nr:type II toxin-antitoxin system RelE/ParE family toxin [Bacteroidota bacterium]